MDIKTSDLLGNYIPFKINGDEKMRVDGSGNVGIGTLTPSNKLHINGTLQVDAGDIKLAWGASGINRKLAIENSDTYRNGLLFKESRELQLFSCGASGDGGRITFFTRAATAANSSDYGTERLRITESGNVGIGTSTPGYKLDVNGVVKTQNPYLFVAFSSNGTRSVSAPTGKFPFDTVIFDTENGYNTTTYIYTVKKTGIYHITGSVYSNSSNADNRSILVAGGYSYRFINTNGITEQKHTSTVITLLNTNDQVYWYVHVGTIIAYGSQSPDFHTWLTLYMLG
jgi:hypothetical protein